MTSFASSPAQEPPGRYHARRSPGAALSAAALQAVIGYLLITGLAVELRAHVPDELKTFTIGPPPPPPPVEKIERPKAKSHKPDGAASPANLRAKPTEVVAPPVVVPPVQPPPIAAAPKPGPGAASFAGASDVPGPGTGAGGQGNGTGSGDQGEGDGDGDDTPPRLLRGQIKDSDYPRAVWETQVPRSLLTRLTVDATGRVTSCAVARSSGNAAFDAVTCRVVEQRFRFKPARDAHGRAVPGMVEGEHEWSGHPPAADESDN